MQYEEIMRRLARWLVPVAALLAIGFVCTRGFAFNYIAAAAFYLLIAVSITTYFRQRLRGELAQFFANRIPPDDDPARAEQSDLAMIAVSIVWIVVGIVGAIFQR